MLLLNIAVYYSVCDPSIPEQFGPSAPQQGSGNQRQENPCGNCDTRNHIEKQTFEHVRRKCRKVDSLNTNIGKYLILMLSFMTQAANPIFDLHSYLSF